MNDACIVYILCIYIYICTHIHIDVHEIIESSTRTFRNHKAICRWHHRKMTTRISLPCVTSVPKFGLQALNKSESPMLNTVTWPVSKGRMGGAADGTPGLVDKIFQHSNLLGKLMWPPFGANCYLCWFSWRVASPCSYWKRCRSECPFDVSHPQLWTCNSHAILHTDFALSLCR